MAEESAQQCKEENDMDRLMGKKEDFGGDMLYLYVSSMGGISHDVSVEETMDLWDAFEVKELELC